jgi:hypothetical protein
MRSVVSLRIQLWICSWISGDRELNWKHSLRSHRSRMDASSNFLLAMVFAASAINLSRSYSFSARRARASRVGTVASVPIYVKFPALRVVKEVWILVVEPGLGLNDRFSMLDSPPFTLGPADRIIMAADALSAPEAPRLFLYYKPVGLVTTVRDEKSVRPSLPSAMVLRYRRQAFGETFGCVERVLPLKASFRFSEV